MPESTTDHKITSEFPTNSPFAVAEAERSVKLSSPDDLVENVDEKLARWTNRKSIRPTTPRSH